MLHILQLPIRKLEPHCGVYTHVIISREIAGSYGEGRSICLWCTLDK